jgi:integrase
MAGSIRKQGKDSWSVMIELGRDPVTKKRRRLWMTVTGTKKDAQRACTAALAQRDHGIDILPAKLTVGEYLQRWLRDYAANNVAPSTFARYLGIVKHHWTPTIGAIRLLDLRPAHIQAAQAAALASGRADGAQGGLSRRTVLHHHRLLHEALKHAVELQLMASNPADAVRPPRPERHEVRALDGNEVTTLLEAARATPLFAFLTMAVTTGARLGELLALRWEDLNLDARTMHITRTVGRIPGRGLTFGPPKTHRSRRTIALSSSAVAALGYHRHAQVEQHLKLGPAYGDQGLVFASPTGHVWDCSNLRRGFERLLQEVGIKRIRIHDLRHTAATLMLLEGQPAKVVAEMLGHATVALTLDTYSHILPGMQRRAADAMDRVLGGTVVNWSGNGRENR